MFEGRALMLVKLVNAQFKQGFLQDIREGFLRGAINCLLSRKNGMVDDSKPLPSALEQCIQEPLNHL